MHECQNSYAGGCSEHGMNDSEGRYGWYIAHSDAERQAGTNR